jgi:tRNA-dihydrouridine synthase B
MMFQTTTELLIPIRIGNITIDPPLFLAPMAGQTNHPFRLLTRELGDVGLVCTELISSTGMHYDLKRSSRYFDWTDAERPLAVQLFGSDIKLMAEAAKIVADLGADIVDINMGCWVPKVAKKQGAGAALLKDVCTATTVVEAVVRAVDIPVTVKVRSGWDAANPTAVEFARAAENSGVQAIAVHARFAEQGFTGTADWDMIRKVKEAVKYIPVIGNGDVITPEDARRMLETTGCDGVMIGRAALGNPWIFRQVTHELRTGEKLPPPTLQERAEMVLKQARITLETTRVSQRQALFELRGQLCKYCVGFPYSASVRDQLVRAESMADIEAAVAPMLN